MAIGKDVTVINSRPMRSSTRALVAIIEKQPCPFGSAPLNLSGSPFGYSVKCPPADRLGRSSFCGGGRISTSAWLKVISGITGITLLGCQVAMK